MIGFSMLQRIGDCVEKGDFAQVGIPDLLSANYIVTYDYQADKGSFIA